MKTMMTRLVLDAMAHVICNPVPGHPESVVLMVPMVMTVLLLVVQGLLLLMLRVPTVVMCVVLI